MRAVNGTSRKRIWFYIQQELIQTLLEAMVAVGCKVADIFWHQNCSEHKNHKFNKAFRIM
jgi:hypothetical protein